MGRRITPEQSLSAAASVNYAPFPRSSGMLPACRTAGIAMPCQPEHPRKVSLIARCREIRDWIFRSHPPTAAEDANANAMEMGLGSSTRIVRSDISSPVPVFVTVKPSDLLIDHKATVVQVSGLRLGALDREPAVRPFPRHSPDLSLSPPDSQYFTPMESFGGGGSTSTPPWKSGSGGSPPRFPTSAVILIDGDWRKATEDGWSGFDVFLFTYDLGVLAATSAEIKNVVGILDTVPTVFFFMAMGVAVASMGIGIFTANYRILPICSCNCQKLSAFSARLSTVLSTGLFITTTSCNLFGRIGCIAGVSFAGAVMSFMTTLWALEKPSWSQRVEKAFTGLWGSLLRWGGQKKPAPPAKNNRRDLVV